MDNIPSWHHPVDESDQWDGFNDSGIEHFRGRPIPHLAREINQNALDAQAGGPVQVRFTLKQVDTSTIPCVGELRRNLRLCAEAARDESAKAVVFFENALEQLEKPKVPVLEISDFNTTGMKGPSENGTPFYAFMKARGQSRKVSETAAGSYGIGKYAPYAVSGMRTIFVSTVFNDDSGSPMQLTQGKAILMSHDLDGERRQGVGFWGSQEKCRPVEGVSAALPKWVQRATDPSELPTSLGTKISVLSFDQSQHWEEQLAVSVAENFFGAINGGVLNVEIGSKLRLDDATIADFFARNDVRDLISSEKDEPDHFDNCRHYLEALQNSTEVIIEESEMRELGLVQLRILISEGLPKKVCALRNGMFISDSLNGLKMFNDFKEFVAVVQCQSTKGNELLRAMEPPRHDDFEPERLPTPKEQRKGKKALKELAHWVREMLRRHAKAPVSSVTEVEELRDFFGDEGADGSGKGLEEVNPFGEIVIRARPVKPKVRKAADGRGSDGGGQGSDNEGGGGSDGSGGGDGSGGQGDGSGGTGGATPSKPAVGLSNVRAIVRDPSARRISFTPQKTGRISLHVLEAGADADYAVGIRLADRGTVDRGMLIMDVASGTRETVEITLDQAFDGALKVVAHEV